MSDKRSDEKKASPEKANKANRQWHTSIHGIACTATLTIRPSYYRDGESIKQSGHTEHI